MKVRGLTYEEALRRHPAEVKAIVDKLRAGKSKHREVAPSELSWSYDCAVLIEQGVGSFADVLTGKLAREQEEYAALSIDERVADQVRRTTTALEARIGRWYGGERIPNPPEIAENARAAFEEQDRERREYLALPPEEQERQTQEAVGQFLRGGGMIMSFGNLVDDD